MEWVKTITVIITKQQGQELEKDLRSKRILRSVQVIKMRFFEGKEKCTSTNTTTITRPVKWLSSRRKIGIRFPVLTGIYLDVTFFTAPLESHPVHVSSELISEGSITALGVKWTDRDADYSPLLSLPIQVFIVCVYRHRGKFSWTNKRWRDLNIRFLWDVTACRLANSY